MNSSNKQQYDLVVVGAGSAGLTAAKIAARHRLKVALLERGNVGGDCLHTGCVPSKTFIHIARRVYDGQQPSSYMVPRTGKINFLAIQSEVRKAQGTIIEQGENDNALSAAGIDIIHGGFTFHDAYTLVSDGKRIQFKKCIITTGSQPIMPPIPGVNVDTCLTSDTIWQLNELPSCLAIIGGGPIGLELGQAFAMLGAKVIIFERGERLVPRFDSDVSAALSQGIQQAGAQIIFNSKVLSLEKLGTALKLNYEAGGNKHELSASHVMVATGRQPITSGLGLEKIGIACNERGGIIVDKQLRTSRKHIYAAGDCLAGPLFTHWAAEQATAAALHALFGIRKNMNAASLPSATFTSPEIGQLGASEQELKSQGTVYRKLSVPFSDIDKAVAESAIGFINVFLDARSYILGATIVGNNAAELIGYFATAMQLKIPFTRFSKTLQAYPTYTIAIKQLAGELRLDSFSHSGSSKLLLRLRGY